MWLKLRALRFGWTVVLLTELKSSNGPVLEMF